MGRRAHVGMRYGVFVRRALDYGVRRIGVAALCTCAVVAHTPPTAAAQAAAAPAKTGLGAVSVPAQAATLRLDAQPVTPRMHRRFPPGGRIVGGTHAVIGTWPSVVEVVWDRVALCTGSLVSPWLVLTAAHCVHNLTSGVSAPASDVLVFGGDVNPSAADATVYPVASYVLNPSFTTNPLNYDVALLTLTAPAPQAAALLDDAGSGNQVAGTQLWAAGFGQTSDTGGGPSPVLNQIVLPVVDDAACAAAWPPSAAPYDYLAPSMLCAGRSDGTGPCHGDSGGPLASFDTTGIETLVATASWASAPACNALPPVYMRVSAMRAWLDPVIANAGPAVGAVSITSVSASSASVTGSGTPAGGQAASTLTAELQHADGSGDTTATAASLPAGTGQQSITDTWNGLRSDTTYRVRLVASNGTTMATSAWAAFTTTDVRAPGIRVRDTTGWRGGRLLLRVLLTDSADAATFSMRVLNGSRIVWRAVHGAVALGSAQWSSVRWRSPLDPQGPYRYCASARDQSGNTTPWVCARIRFRR